MNLLLAEDDERLRKHLASALETAGHAVTQAADGIRALELLTTQSFDAAVIDINMPGKNGIDVIRLASQQGCRALLVISSARGELDDKIKGLDAGADDYLVKPYSTEELLARLRALQRRADSSQHDTIKIDDLEISIASRKVKRNTCPILLTNREFALLEALALASPRPVSKAMLVEKVWDQYFDASTNVVNVYVNYLRKKIDLPNLPPLIQTIRGSGFALRKETSP